MRVNVEQGINIGVVKNVGHAVYKKRISFTSLCDLLC